MTGSEPIPEDRHLPAGPPVRRSLTGAVLAAPRLARFGASASIRTTRWGAQATVRVTRFVIRSAVSG